MAVARCCTCTCDKTELPSECKAPLAPCTMRRCIQKVQPAELLPKRATIQCELTHSSHVYMDCTITAKVCVRSNLTKGSNACYASPAFEIALSGIAGAKHDSENDWYTSSRACIYTPLHAWSIHTFANIIVSVSPDTHCALRVVNCASTLPQVSLTSAACDSSLTSGR
jgi:hypothetical protein